MKLDDAIEKYQLSRYTDWASLNLPPGSNSEVTYFLEGGNLNLTIDQTRRIASAKYTASSLPASERIAACFRAWDEWVKAHSTKKAQPSAPANGASPRR